MTCIYLDNCCLNRPFDIQAHPSVRLETEAIQIILNHVKTGAWVLVSSDIIRYENQNSNRGTRYETSPTTKGARATPLPLWNPPSSCPRSKLRGIFSESMTIISLNRYFLARYGFNNTPFAL